MSYQSIEPALNRLKNTIRKKGFPDDVEALNFVIDWINVQMDSNGKAYPLVNKMFIWIFQHLALSDACKGSARLIMDEIMKIISTPTDWLLDDLTTTIQGVRTLSLYHDYNEEVREATRVAEANKIPAEKSESLEAQYRLQDVENVAIAKRNRLDKIRYDIENELTKPFTREQTEAFVKREVSRILVGG